MTADGTPLTRREVREREALMNPVAGQAPTAGTLPESTALRPTSVSALLFPEYTAHRLAVPEPVAPSRRSIAASTPVRSVKSSRPGRATVKPSAVTARKRPSASSKFLSLVAMLFAGALLVGTSLPANAFFGDTTEAVTAVSVSTTPDVALQTVDVSADADPSAISRDGFSVVSYQELMQATGHAGGTFTPTTGSIRWPFPYSVPISDGWGPRVAPCDGCSTFHQGVDFTPGAGTPIYAIADGVVEEHSGDSQWESFGNHVVIQHSIPGQNVESLYAHMIAGSSTLQPGDHVKVGDFIGLVGDTGSATGPHLHLEVHIDKVPVDPYAWLQANATNVP